MRVTTFFIVAVFVLIALAVLTQYASAQEKQTAKRDTVVAARASIDQADEFFQGLQDQITKQIAELQTRFKMYDGRREWCRELKQLGVDSVYLPVLTQISDLPKADSTKGK